jgi:hypothetical protein
MDAQLYTKIYFGNNNQELDVLLDTGSSKFWVATDQCGNCNMPEKF